MFEKVLVANRGEIAVRVIRALRGARASRPSPSTRRPTATRRTCRPPTRRTCSAPAPAAESYLNIEKILEVAKQSGAEAIHPGYGFLAENAAFAQALDEAGMTFIGPPAERDRGDGLEDPGARDHAGGRRADRARHDRPRSTTVAEASEDARRRSATRSPSRPRAAAAARASASR